ncbi:hypothetical protein EJB05_36773, partial [Eragrostis curvula]
MRPPCRQLPVVLFPFSPNSPARQHFFLRTKPSLRRAIDLLPPQTRNAAVTAQVLHAQAHAASSLRSHNHELMAHLPPPFTMVEDEIRGSGRGRAFLGNEIEEMDLLSYLGATISPSAKVTFSILGRLAPKRDIMWTGFVSSLAKLQEGMRNTMREKEEGQGPYMTVGLIRTAIGVGMITMRTKAR